ncbi:triosephosphate isomerase (TIM) [Nematocida major]|uniref:triosephosphate isomerase (TIM) n=1 Tax=Nematocida major TaxID=1912982 RepID=UPI00200885CE|nr:triosephosphate isomerase (TIM) [Nematocida major]KAH9385684.1 triosephosphate isomerase (TIM) [Nematocida major]
MRICAGNWKMNGTLETVHELSKEMNRKKAELAGTEIIVAPPYTLLMEARRYFDPVFKVGAQGICPYAVSGAYTGGVGAVQVKDLHVESVIIGHSERGKYFKETEEEVHAQLKMAMESELEIILCVGETEEERSAGKTEEVVQKRLCLLKEVLTGITPQVIIAYEPVWAIGTGVVPAVEEIQPIVSLIHAEMGSSIKGVLYGGSVGKENAASLMQIKNLSGFLVGNASLTSEFVEICGICNSSRSE